MVLAVGKTGEDMSAVPSFLLYSGFMRPVPYIWHVPYIWQNVPQLPTDTLLSIIHQYNVVLKR